MQNVQLTLYFLSASIALPDLVLGSGSGGGSVAVVHQTPSAKGWPALRGSGLSLVVAPQVYHQLVSLPHSAPWESVEQLLPV